VKRAFVERSLRFRSGGSERGDATSANAFRLREINDAWATLRNPQARADYDECLVAAAAVAAEHHATNGGLAWLSPYPASPAASTGFSAGPGSGAVLVATRPVLHPVAEVVAPIALEPLAANEPTEAASRSALRRWLPLVLTVIAVAAVLCALARSTSHAPVARDVSIQSSSADAASPTRASVPR
jgi:hypothetical protein